MVGRHILGIDPGSVVTGWGCVVEGAVGWSSVGWGAVRPARTAPLSVRYHTIFEAVLGLIDRFTPEALAIETQFVGRNPQSALKLGMARGVVLVAAAARGIPVFEYSPTRIKQAVTGHGHAPKDQVQFMMLKLLGLQELPTPEDAADALATALCHAQARRFPHLVGSPT